MRAAILVGTVTSLLFVSGGATAQKDIADIKSEDVLIGKDKNKRYFRIEPKKKQKKQKPYGLVIIMPGGSGSADFHGRPRGPARRPRRPRRPSR